MDEIEVKILEINVKKTLAKIESLGATKTFEGDLEAIYFDTPDKSLRNTNRILRLRRKGPITELTFKKRMPSTSVKHVKEYETKVTDFENTYKLLIGLGYEERRRTSKHRISYKLGEAGIEIDTYLGSDAHVPTFLEIETQDGDAIKARYKLSHSGMYIYID